MKEFFFSFIDQAFFASFTNYKYSHLCYVVRITTSTPEVVMQDIILFKCTSSNSNSFAHLQCMKTNFLLVELLIKPCISYICV